jgi:hypothetical protein
MNHLRKLRILELICVELAEEIEQMLRLKRVRILPLIASTAGIVPGSVTNVLKNFKPKYLSPSVQRVHCL